MAYRSKAERALAQWLKSHKIKFEYETKKYDYNTRVVKGVCDKCGHDKCSQRHTYLLDFWLPEYNFGIEFKGKLTGKDRTKYVSVVGSNPTLDLRLVFIADNRLRKDKPKRYSEWASENNFKYSIKIPDGRWFS